MKNENEKSKMKTKFIPFHHRNRNSGRDMSDVDSSEGSEAETVFVRRYCVIFIERIDDKTAELFFAIFAFDSDCRCIRLLDFKTDEIIIGEKIQCKLLRATSNACAAALRKVLFMTMALIDLNNA